MTLSAHLNELKKKHTNLNIRIETAQRAPSADALELVAMKKQKLKIKEEIHRLSN